MLGTRGGRRGNVDSIGTRGGRRRIGNSSGTRGRHMLGTRGRRMLETRKRFPESERESLACISIETSADIGHCTTLTLYCAQP